MTVTPEIRLHVGLAKTGSTAIQAALFAHKAQLLSMGILYPGKEANHYHLQSLFADDPHRLIQVRRLGLANPEAERSYLEAFRAAFEREVGERQPRCIVLSSEYIPAMSEHELRRLADYLQGFGGRLRVLTYLRDPWTDTISQAQQELRDGVWSGPISLGYRGDTLPLLERLEQGLGARVEARIYKGDIVSDFADWIGVPVKNDGVRANVGVGHEVACVLTVLNELYPQYVDGALKFDGARDWMVDAVIQAFPEANPIRLSKTTARMIHEQASADLDAICERFFEGCSAFSEFYDESMFTNEDDAIDASKLAPAVLAEGMLRALRFLSERGAYFHDQFKSLNDKVRFIKQLVNRLPTDGA